LEKVRRKTEEADKIENRLDIFLGNAVSVTAQHYKVRSDIAGEVIAWKNTSASETQLAMMPKDRYRWTR